ncbi:hypothetical protein [Microbacterium sp. KNMS]
MVARQVAARRAFLVAVAALTAWAFGVAASALIYARAIGGGHA